VRARALELSPVLARLHGDERIDAGRLQLVEQRLQRVDQLLR
jgi:ribosome assembly protein YihI (activator of Der GTPase)